MIGDLEAHACDECDAPIEVLSEATVTTMFPYEVVVRAQFIRCVNGHQHRREAA